MLNLKAIYKYFQRLLILHLNMIGVKSKRIIPVKKAEDTLQIAYEDKPQMAHDESMSTT